jgi:hypothetical protein
MLETVGVFADLDEADAAHPPEPRGWLERAKYAIGARLVNRRVARLRRERWDGALRIA